MARQVFSGDKKDGVSLLHHAEDRLKATLIPCVPKGIETYHLTLTTIVWSVLVILFSWLATFNRQWMWGVSGAIVAQYITDLLDGAIGRRRNTGLVKWGYYMDHFLDYVFLCAMLIGYSLLIPNHMKYIMFFVMAVFCGFMVNSFLQFAATNKFKIAYWGVGPTEMRLVFILINTLIIYLNQSVYVQTIPYILGIASFGLFFTALNTQRELWAIDMTAKAEEQGDAEPQEEDLQGLVLRHFLLSFIIASLAFLVLVMRIGAPFHKIMAGVVYATSWLPILSALTHKNWIHLKTSSWVRKFVPLSSAAAILILSAWVAFSLRPSMTPKAYSTSLMRRHMPVDINTVTDINTQMTDLFSGKPRTGDPTSDDLLHLKKIGPEFLNHQKTLTNLIASYEGYYTLERQENAQLHDQAFLIWFSALAIQQNSILNLMELGTSEQIKAAIAPTSPPDTSNNNVFDELIRSVVLPNTLVKIGYSTTYLRLIAGQKPSEVSSDAKHNAVEQLSHIAQANISAYYAKLETNSGVILEILRATTYPN